MKYPIYTEAKNLKSGLYLGLFHGAKTLKERKALGDAGNWGSNGPAIGPLEYVHTTYAQTVKFRFTDEADWKQYGLEQENHITIPGKDIPRQNIEADCFRFDGVNYGDWTVFQVKGKYNEKMF